LQEVFGNTKTKGPNQDSQIICKKSLGVRTPKDLLLTNNLAILIRSFGFRTPNVLLTNNLALQYFDVPDESYLQRHVVRTQLDNFAFIQSFVTM
jgi:hypothetical protein